MQEAVNQNWTLTRLTEALSGLVKEVRGASGRTFTQIATDSRTIGQGEVFLALRGEKFDGHAHAAEAVTKGAAALIVEEAIDTDIPQIIVRDTREAYGALARAWRSQFAIPLISVVGSNGKTTTTQMIACILREAVASEAASLATEGNFNNEVGVPRMLLRLTSETKIAVIEAGMNHSGEMARLASWVRPTVAVVTNAQREHQAYIDGVAGSARENGLMVVALSAKGTAVLPLTDPSLKIWFDYARARGCSVLTYAANADGAYVKAFRQGEKLVIQTPSQSIETTLAMAGDHAVHDAAAAAAASLAAGVSLESIARGLAAFRPIKGRGRMYRLANGSVLIDESYNANPDSMRAAIDVLSQMPAPRVLVAGEMGELGEMSSQYHAEIVKYARSKGIEGLLTTGEAFRDSTMLFGAGSFYYETREALGVALFKALDKPCSVLVKASHYVGLDAIVKAILESDDAASHDAM